MNKVDIQALVAEHGDYLYSYAKSRIASESDLEDVLQETFLAALRSAENFRSESSPRTWLVGILRNKIIDYYRSKNRRNNTVSLDAPGHNLPPGEYPFRKEGHWQTDRQPTSWQNTPLQEMEKKEVRTHIDKCIRNLPGTMSTVYVLRELENRKTSEICDLLSLQETHINVLIYRARLHLRACLEKFGIKNAAAG